MYNGCPCVFIIQGEIMRLNINYPTNDYRHFIEYITGACKNNKMLLILKGSLIKGTATKYSDIDLVIVGNVTNNKLNQIIVSYDNPIMTNFTENPKGILIIVYKNGLCVDIDVKESISSNDLIEGKILVGNKEHFRETDKEIRRIMNGMDCLPEREEWYKIIRLIHRGLIKYLSNKRNEGNNLLLEIKHSMKYIEINNLKYNDNFKTDINIIFHEICNRYNVCLDIQVLIKNLIEKIN